MRARTQYYWLVGAVLLASASACSYSPHPEDGKQQCYSTSRQCPDGYVCQADGYCWSAGHAPVVTPGTGGVIPGTGGATGGSGGTSAKGGNVGGGGMGVGGVVVTGGKVGSGGLGGELGGIISGGGSPSTGGIAGTGGATSCQPTRASGSYPLIDNMADGDTAIIAQDGRSGGWYAYGDNTGSIALVSSNLGQMCVSGSGFTSWGAGLGVNVNATPTTTCTYDASVYTGIRFTIQGSVTNGMGRFSAQTADIASVSGGGTCVSTSTSNNCDDTYGADLLEGSTSGITCQSTVLSWTCGSLDSTNAGGPLTVSIPFSYMSQQGWGKAYPTFNPKLILGLQWQIHTCSETTCYTSPTSFDLCIGNVSFF